MHGLRLGLFLERYLLHLCRCCEEGKFLGAYPRPRKAQLLQKCSQGLAQGTHCLAVGVVAKELQLSGGDEALLKQEVTGPFLGQNELAEI